MEKTATAVLAELENTGIAMQQVHSGALMSGDMLFEDSKFSKIMQFAEVMASGRSTIPQHLQKSTGDCVAVTMQALRWGLDPFTVAQKTHLVNGTLGYEAQLIHAVILNSGILATRPSYEYQGDWDKIDGLDTKAGDPKEKGLKVIVSARLKGEDFDRTHEVLLSDCTIRNSPNWKRKRKLQIGYVGVREWVRVHAPDVLMGVYAEDEMQLINAPKNINNASSNVVSFDVASNTVSDDHPVLMKIAACKTAEDVHALKTDISMLKGPVRKAAITAATDKLDSFTVELEQSVQKEKSNSPAPTYAEIMDGIQKATNPDDVDAELSLAGHLPADQIQELELAANKRKATFN